MGLLTDAEIKVHIAAGDLLTSRTPIDLERSIRGCSADMHVGEIYRPQVYGASRELKVGSPYTRFSLAEGETAMVRTIEEFSLDAQHSAVVLPTNSVSMKGLLMTNPGHVDPGYRGPIHVTVINMGRRPYELRQGDRFLRALIFKLDGHVDTTAPRATGNPINEQLLDTLSPDFLSVQTRAADAARVQVNAMSARAQLLQFVIPSVLTAIGVVATAIYNNNSIKADFERRLHDIENVKVDARIQKLDADLQKLGNDFPTEKRLTSMERQLQELAAQANQKGK